MKVKSKRAVFFFWALIIACGLSVGLVPDRVNSEGWIISHAWAEPAPGTAAKGAPLYWMSVATSNQTIPGMSKGSGFMGKLMGKVTGLGGAKTTLDLQLNSSPVKPSPEAAHDIPPGQKMGDTLPLISPEKAKGEGAKGQRRPRPKTMRKQEPPKQKILFYWGCSEEVRPGQPRVLDTAKINNTAFAKAMQGHRPSRQYPPTPRRGWIYSEWPNRESDIEVPADASLQGPHFIHGNYIPHIKFTLGPKHDIMKPVEFSSVTGGLKDSIHFQWKAIPTAIGYFAVAMAHNQETGEMIVWSSSDIFEPGWGLLDYLPSRDVRRFIKKKVVMPASVTSCVIPKGIFKGAGGASLQFIAWGPDFYASYPPKPKKAPKSWKPDWRAKARFKSTGMVMLGQAMGQSQKEGAQEQKGEDQATEKEKSGPLKHLKKLKSLFGK